MLPVVFEEFELVCIFFASFFLFKKNWLKVNFCKNHDITTLSFSSVVFDGWGGRIDNLLMFLSSRALINLPLVQRDVSSLHQFWYRCSKCEVLRSMENFSSKMVDGLIWNLSSFSALLVFDKWLNKVYGYCLGRS